MVYMLYFAIFFIASFFDFKSDKCLRQYIVLLLFIYSIIFIGLRFHTGSDWFLYTKYYNVVDWENQKYGFGFKSLNILCKKIFNDYYAMQFLSSMFFIYSAFHFFTKNTRYPIAAFIISICLYFGDLYMSQIRQSLAIGIILLGSDYIFEKKLKQYLCVILCASLFHITALLAFPLYFLRMKLNKHIRVLVILFALLCIVKKAIPMQILNLIANFFPGQIGKLAIKYLSNPLFSHGSELSSGLYFYARFLLALFIVLFYKPKYAKDYIFINCLTLSCFIISFSLTISVVRRVEYYYAFFAILGYFKLLDIDIIKNKHFFILYYMLFIVFFFFPFAKYRKGSENSRYIPYYNYLNYPSEAEYRKDWYEIDILK